MNSPLWKKISVFRNQIIGFFLTEVLIIGITYVEQPIWLKCMLVLTIFTGCATFITTMGKFLLILQRGWSEYVYVIPSDVVCNSCQEFSQENEKLRAIIIQISFSPEQRINSSHGENN